MRFVGIQLVEQTEQKIRRIRERLVLNFQKEMSDCNSWAFYSTSAD